MTIGNSSSAHHLADDKELAQPTHPTAQTQTAPHEYLTHGAQAVGIANIAADGSVLDTWYPDPELIAPERSANLHTGTQRLSGLDLPRKLLNLVRLDEDRQVEQVAVRTTIANLSQPPVDAHDTYLRLHLLSHRLVTPHSINMNKALSRLRPVVWTNKGPCLTERFEDVRTTLRARGLIHVYGIDRLPRMVDYVVPSDVQIIEAERVRLGAYLAPGTMVLREGYVSYNAGTLGPGRVEGRLYSGTLVGTNLDMGISASLVPNRPPRTMRVGNNCSIGVSAAVIGINLGDNVHIGNQVLLDRETEVFFADTQSIVAATELEGMSNISIRREAAHSIPVVHRSAGDVLPAQ